MRSSLLLLLVLAGVACGGDDAPATPAPPTETELTDLCAQLATADCARLESCGFLGPLDRAACEARQASILCAPYARALARAEQGGEGTWLASAGRRCVEAAGAGCDRGFSYDLLALDPCAQAFQPRATEGESCSFAGSCVEGTACDARAACPGTCAARGAANEACNPSRPCQPGFYCSLTQMRCLTPSAEGADCETLAVGSSCQPGSFCDGSQPGGARCVAGRGRGSGCSSAAECAVGLRCLRNRCSAGEATDACAADADCRGRLRCAAGRCVEPGTAGEPCGSDAECARGLVCGPDGCAAGIADGEACDPELSCASGRCADGSCAAPSGDGESCADAADCLEGRACIEGACRAVGPFCPV